MRSPFANAMSVALATLRGVAGEAVDYSRDDRSVQVTAVKGQPLQQIDQQAMARINTAMVDWLVEVRALCLDGEPITPEKGDRITVIVGGQAVVYEVIAPSSGEPVFEYSDHARTQYRVHCKEVRS